MKKINLYFVYKILFSKLDSKIFILGFAANLSLFLTKNICVSSTYFKPHFLYKKQKIQFNFYIKTIEENKFLCMKNKYFESILLFLKNMMFLTDFGMKKFVDLTLITEYGNL